MSLYRGSAVEIYGILDLTEYAQASGLGESLYGYRRLHTAIRRQSKNEYMN